MRQLVIRIFKIHTVVTREARTRVEAEDAVNDANRHGANERWKFMSRILEGIRRQQGLVGPPMRVSCGPAHARP
jgi:hypothetical protein